MPLPSSVMPIRRRPPPSVKMSIRLAPASMAFSTSSLTTLAGRSTTSPAARFNHSTGPYQLVDGTQVADNWADLTDGSIDHAIDLDQDGLAVGAPPTWTGTRIDGTVDADHCFDWTSSNFGDSGMGGVTTDADNNWTSNLPFPCSVMAHLYCFEQ